MSQPRVGRFSSRYLIRTGRDRISPSPTPEQPARRADSAARRPPEHEHTLGERILNTAAGSIFLLRGGGGGAAVC